MVCTGGLVELKSTHPLSLETSSQRPLIEAQEHVKTLVRPNAAVEYAGEEPGRGLV